MVQREGTHPGQAASVSLKGTLVAQPKLAFATISRQYLIRGLVKVGDSEIPIVASGDIAKTLADLQAKTELTLKGDLAVHDWAVNGGKDGKRQLEVNVQEIVACEKPPTCWQPSGK